MTEFKKQVFPLFLSGQESGGSNNTVGAVGSFGVGSGVGTTVGSDVLGVITGKLVFQ